MNANFGDGCMFKDGQTFLSYLLEAKCRIGKQLFLYTSAHIEENFQHLYEQACLINNKEALKIFQLSLVRIPILTFDVIENNYKRFKRNVTREMVQSIKREIAHMCELYRIIKYVKKNGKFPSNRAKKVPLSTKDFLHRCYIYVGRKLWSCPELLSHKFPREIMSENKSKLQNTIKEGINDVIADFIPTEDFFQYFTAGASGTDCNPVVRKEELSFVDPPAPDAPDAPDAAVVLAEMSGVGCPDKGAGAGMVGNCNQQALAMQDQAPAMQDQAVQAQVVQDQAVQAQAVQAQAVRDQAVPDQLKHLQQVTPMQVPVAQTQATPTQLAMSAADVVARNDGAIQERVAGPIEVPFAPNGTNGRVGTGTCQELIKPKILLMRKGCKRNESQGDGILVTGNVATHPPRHKILIRSGDGKAISMKLLDGSPVEVDESEPDDDGEELSSPKIQLMNSSHQLSSISNCSSSFKLDSPKLNAKVQNGQCGPYGRNGPDGDREQGTRDADADVTDVDKTMDRAPVPGTDDCTNDILEIDFDLNRSKRMGKVNRCQGGRNGVGSKSPRGPPRESSFDGTDDYESRDTELTLVNKLMGLDISRGDLLRMGQSYGTSELSDAKIDQFQRNYNRMFRKRVPLKGHT